MYMRGVHGFCTKLPTSADSIRAEFNTFIGHRSHLDHVKKLLAKAQEQGLVGKVKCIFITSLQPDIIIMLVKGGAFWEMSKFPTVEP